MSEGRMASGGSEREKNSIALALSGGGLRATLFELGIVLYLAAADELKNVSAVVSVSGGSILAAHLATRWGKATASLDSFVDVAAELVKFTQSDVRNSIIVKYIWSGGFIFSFFRFGRKLTLTAFLERHYRRLFSRAVLGDLPHAAGDPVFAFVATDATEHHRVALTPGGIYRFPFNGDPMERRILSVGTPVSLAVAASSCFPLLFKDLELTCDELQIRYDEFRGKVTLTDGGASGNLGFEVLTALIRERLVTSKRIVVCDAECGLAKKPSIRVVNNIQRARNSAFG